MFLALIRRASASPRGRRSPLSVETHAATLGSSMHPTDNDVSPLFLFLQAPHLPILQRTPSFFSLPDLPGINFYENRVCMTTQISPPLGIVPVCQTCSRDRRNLVRGRLCTCSRPSDIFLSSHFSHLPCTLKRCKSAGVSVPRISLTINARYALARLCYYTV
jgi:hypothetical protein